MTNQDKKGFAKWLETLQQESWQLELIISGFAIFLLIGVYEPLLDTVNKLNRLRYLEFRYSFHFMFMGLDFIRLAWNILVINLIVHVFLRGLWISTIGLRYVSGDIAFDELKLSEKFNRFLQTRIGSFDDYIEKLEKICSVIFAFTFLLFFTVLSFLLGSIFYLGLSETIRYFTGLEYEQLFYILQVPFFTLAGIYILDFLTLGWLKKYEKLSKVYYPIYRFFSIISLSFLYRPLYYNLIDNKFGRRIILLMVPYLIMFMTIGNFNLNLYLYLPSDRYFQTLAPIYYDDERLPNTTNAKMSIPSKYLNNEFIELFLPHIPKDHHAVLEKLCPNLEFASASPFQKKADDPRHKLNADSTLNCISSLYKVFLDDSLQTNHKYRFYYHPQRKEEGLITIIDAGYLSRGEHILKIESKYLSRIHEEDEPVKVGTYHIPFWKE